MSKEISKIEFIAFQNAWGEAVVNVGKHFIAKTDYKQAAVELVEQFYGYKESTVLFKPTRAQHIQFRLTAQSAISYFVGNDTNFGEDTGFALQPWTNVRFENADFVLKENYAVAMGNYYFTDRAGQEKQVEYTLGVFRSETGSLKINLHHSSLPYLHPKHPNN